MQRQIPPQLEDALVCLQELHDDGDCSKSLKSKAASIIALLQNDTELSVQKSLFALEEINASDLSPYLRTKVWDIISLLESCNGN